MGVSEVAEMIGVSRQRADQLSRQKGFPEPVGMLGKSRQRIWAEADVRAWIRQRDMR